MRIIFMGTPDFAVPTLDALVAAGHTIVAVYSQPPRPGGRRGRELVASPVQARAEALGIEVRTPVSLKPEAEKTAFAALGAEVAVVAAYGLILPAAVLAAPVHGCLNVHGSLLPRWRGAAPIQRAILAGDAETGVGIMQMEAGLDTGPVRLEGRTPVAGKTAGALTDELAAMGARLMATVLADPAAYPPVPQPADGITYAAKIDKAEARLDFTRPAVEVERAVRAFNPAPGAFFELGGERVKLLAAAVVPDVATLGVSDRSGRASAEAAAVETPGESLMARPSTALGTNGGNSDGAVGSGTNDQRDGLSYEGQGRHEAVVPGTVLDDRLTIACGTGAILPALVQRAGRGVMTPTELLRGFPIPPGTRL